MKIRDFIPPVAVRALAAVAKSFASDWVRGRDLDGGSAARRVSFLEPYAQSAWVRAAVNQISGPISGRPLHFYQGEQRLADAALAAWWQAPALGPRSLGAQARLPLAEVLRDLAAWDAYEGEFFLVLGDEWLTTGGRALGAGLPPFMIPHPQRMQAIVMGGMLTAWRYVDAGGRTMTFVPEQVIHAKGWNPHDDWRGVGGMQAARIAAEGAFLTGAYLRDLARNNGDQGFVVIAKSGVVTPEQRDQITADLRAKRAALARGEARDLLLGGEITIDRPKEEAASAELVASLGLSQQEVFVAFEVPPSRAAVKQAYSIGKESDTYQLITERCMPLGGRIAAAFARVAQMQTGRAIEAELEWDDHPVMVEVRNSRIEAMGKLCDRGMPVKHASDYLQLGMKPFPGWDVGYLPFSVAPVSASTPDPVADPALAEPVDPPAEDPAVAQLRLLLLTRARTAQPVCRSAAPEAAPDAFAAFACTCGEGAPAATKARDPKELAQWRSLMAKRRETVKSITSALGRVIMQARVETLRKIDDELAGKTEAGRAKAAAADLVFDLVKFAASLRDVMAAQHRRGLDLAGQQLFDEIEKTDPFTYPPEAVVQFLRQRQNRLRDVPQEMFERIRATIDEALQAGETTAQIAARVKAEFNDIADGHAHTIAITETAAVYGAGRAQAMEQAGIQWKRWLTSGNANVRAEHAAANGQTVRIDESFTVGGELLRHPGDSAGSAANVINCHCVSIAAAEGPDA